MLRLQVVPGRFELPTSTLSVWRSNQLSYRTGRKNPRGGESNRALTSCTEDGTGRPGFIFLYNFITSCEKYRTESLEGESYLLCQSPPLSKPFGTETHGVSFQKGGVPAAPSGTATLLRLSPNHRFYPRPTLAVTAFRHPRLSWLDGRCVQGPGTYSPRHG